MSSSVGRPPPWDGRHGLAMLSLLVSVNEFARWFVPVPSRSARRAGDGPRRKVYELWSPAFRGLACR